MRRAPSPLSPLRWRNAPWSSLVSSRPATLLEWQRHPPPFAERLFHRVDDFLHPRPIGEVCLVLFAAGDDLANERRNEVGVEERPPRFTRVAPGRIESLRHRE